MNKKFAFLVLVFAALLSACAGSPVSAMITPTATPNPGEIALNMIQQQMAAEATSQVVGLQFTATAQVLGMTATSQAVSTAEAITQQARIDAQATSDQARRDAVATQQRLDAVATAEQERQDAIFATGQAIVAVQNTQNANATATFTVMTLTAMPGAATATQIALNNDIVMQAQKVERADLDLQQARDTNGLKAFGPWVIAAFAFALAAVVVLRYSNWFVIKNDYGDIEGIGHGKKLIVPKYLPGPVIDLDDMTMPQLTDKANQAEIIRNEQKIRALGAIPVSPAQSGMTAFNQFFSGDKQDEAFEIIEGNVLPPADLLDAETLKITEKEWQDANAK